MKNKLFIIFAVLTIIVVFGVFIYLVKQGKISPLAADEVATLSLSPSTGSQTIGGNFNVDIVLNTYGIETAGTDVVINFNPSDLEVQDADAGVSGVQIQPGTLYTTFPGNTVDNTTGRIFFSGIIVPGGTGYTGTGVLATITFKALKVATTQVAFDFTLGSTVDTNVTSKSTATDVLASVVNGSYNIVPQDVPTSISLNLQGRTNHSATGVSLKVYETGTENLVFEKNNITTDASGSANFTITGVSSGNYDFRIKVGNFLTETITNYSLTIPLSLNFVTLKGGDLNDDNIVNSLDFSILTGKWGLSDAVADINQDGIVNTVDFAILNSNWFVSGT